MQLSECQSSGTGRTCTHKHTNTQNQHKNTHKTHSHRVYDRQTDSTNRPTQHLFCFKLITVIIDAVIWPRFTIWLTSRLPGWSLSVCFHSCWCCWQLHTYNTVHTHTPSTPPATHPFLLPLLWWSYGGYGCVYPLGLCGRRESSRIVLIVPLLFPQTWAPCDSHQEIANSA